MVLKYILVERLWIFLSNLSLRTAKINPSALRACSLAFFLSNTLTNEHNQGGSLKDILTVFVGKHSSITETMHGSDYENLTAESTFSHIFTVFPRVLLECNREVLSIIAHCVFKSHRLNLIPGGKITPL